MAETNTACPHCKSILKEIIYSYSSSAMNADIVRCTNCGHFYLWYDKPINVEKLYKTQAYAMDDQRESVFFKIQKLEYKKVLKKIIHLQPGKTSHQKLLMDFGSGKGHFLLFAQEMGFKVFGVETATERAAFAREKYKLEILSAFYDGMNKINGGSYNVVTMFHVLEHLPEPELITNGLFNLNLNNDGVMVIEVPNFDSWQSKIGGKYWLHLDVPRHINHYTPKFLKLFAEKIGGKVLRQEYFSYHLGIIGMLQSLMSVFGYRKSLIEDLKFKKTPKLLISICLLIIPAFILEVFASMINKGGVIRFYTAKNKLQ